MDVCHARQYVPFFIANHDGTMKSKDNPYEKFFYSFDEDKAADGENSRESKNEFWNKQPTCFRQSSDDPSRLIFRAAARSNFIFDLKMIDGRL